MITDGRSHESELGTSKEGRLAYKYCKHIETSWYSAMASIESMERQIGWDLTREFITRRMAGDKISLNQFCINNNVPRFICGL